MSQPVTFKPRTMAQLGGPSKTFPPFPSIGGGFSSFLRASIPAQPPRYRPEIAAPVPSEGNCALLQNSTDLLARPVRGVCPLVDFPKKKRRRSAVKPDQFMPNVRSRKKKSESVEEEVIGEEQLQEELQAEAEEEDQITPTTKVATRSRRRAPARKTRFSTRKRARSESDRDGGDCGDDSEENVDRSSDEDFM